MVYQIIVWCIFFSLCRYDYYILVVLGSWPVVACSTVDLNAHVVV